MGAMMPVEVSAWESRQVDLLIRRCGADPSKFQLRKFVRPDGRRYRVRVVARGAATVYESEDPSRWMSEFAADLQAGLFGDAAPDPLAATLDAALREVEGALLKEGVAGALKVLNARVPHRFTAVYRLDGAMLRSVAVVDKRLHLDPLDLRAVPLKDSFCQFVLRDGIFVTQDSGSDPRLAGHPYQGVMNCYVGVPVRGRDGLLAGSLCHFDLEDRTLADEDYLLLDRTARLVPAFLQS
jgi:GAF domain-containing protein